MLDIVKTKRNSCDVINQLAPGISFLNHREEIMFLWSRVLVSFPVDVRVECKIIREMIDHLLGLTKENEVDTRKTGILIKC